MVGRLKSESDTSAACLSFMYAALTRAAALMADWAVCRKYLKLCREAIAADAAYVAPASSADGAEDGSLDGVEGEGAGEGERESASRVAGGGKRAWKEASGTREESLQVSVE